MMTAMRKRARDAYRYGLASATDVWTRDRAVVDGLSRVAAAGWLRRGRGRGLLGILRQSLAPAGAAERASWCRGIQQRNRTARGGNSLQSIHTHTHVHQEATGMRLLRQRAAELSSPPPPARSNRGRSFAQGLDARNLLLLLECTGAIMSSQCTTHNPPSCACMCPSARNAVRLAVSSLVLQVCCCRCRFYSSPHTSSVR